MGRARLWRRTIRPRCSARSIEHGRCAYGNQPRITLWNLARLAEALLPLLLDEEEIAGAVGQRMRHWARVPELYEAARLAGLRRKLGSGEGARGRCRARRRLFEAMAGQNQADFTLTFRRLCDAAAGPEGDAGVRTLFADGAAYDSWAVGWRQRLSEEPGMQRDRWRLMRKANPAFIPRNHLVEAVLAAATEREDYRPLRNCWR